MESLLTLIVLLILFGLTVPVAMSFLLAGVFAFWIFTDIPLQLLGQIMIIKLYSYPLLAVLFFILAGNIMVEGKIAEYLINIAGSLVGFIRGGLGMTGVLACGLFGAISGSALATFAAIGGVMVPTLRKHGYGEQFSVGCMAANSVLGIIIPPSIPMILYCVIADVSIARLFLAGIVPGVIIIISMSIWIYYWARKNNIKSFSNKLEIKEIVFHLGKGIWALMLPIIIFGGIFSGIFTATEAAVVTTVYALIVEIYIYKFMKADKIVGVFIESGVTTGTLLIIAAGASTFAEFITLMQVPEKIVGFVAPSITSPLLIMMVIVCFLLVVGCFIDTISAILILTPILVPLATKYQIDLVHLGLVVTVGLGIGYITPPFGATLFLAVAMYGTKFKDVVKGALPSIIIWTVVLILFALFGDISTILPDLVMGKGR